jgi:Lon-like protease
MDTSTADTTSESVLPPPVDSSRIHRRLWWALPLLTVAGLILCAVVAAGSTAIDQWETAPGSAEPVADRIEISEVTRYRAENKVMFVSAYGSRLTALESFVGWLDPDVIVEGKNERFGSISPADQRRMGFQDMATAKQIAEYVALKRLGYDVDVEEGAIIVFDLVCEDEPEQDSACNVLEVGDVITGIDGVETPTLSELAGALKGHKAGDVLDVTVVPYGKIKSEVRKVRMIPNPSDPERSILGFVPADTRKVSLPFEVEIQTAAIGGPSAGLAFTLAILDELTPGELLGSTKVAVTGTISDDGSVGAIGALQQKAVAVKRAGAKVFLVPSGQSEEEIKSAQDAVGSSLRIIQVATLDDALKVLAELGGEPLNKVNATN